MVYENLHILQFMVQHIYHFGRWNLLPVANLSQVKNHWPKPEQRNEVCETDSLVEWLPQMDDSKQKGETTQQISW